MKNFLLGLWVGGMLVFGFNTVFLPTVKGHYIDAKIAKKTELTSSDLNWIQTNWWWSEKILMKENFGDYVKAIASGLCRHRFSGLERDLALITISSPYSNPDIYKEILDMAVECDSRISSRSFFYSLIQYAPERYMDHAGKAQAKASLEKIWNDMRGESEFGSEAK